MNFRRIQTAALLALLIAFPLSGVEAHHAGHGSSGGGSRSLFYQGRQSKPLSRLFAVSDFQYEDNGVGQLWTNSLGGEWAISRRISVLGQLPISYLSHNFAANEAGLGDITVGGKYAFLDGATLLFSTLTLELPTGDEGKGFGLESLGTQADLFFGRQLKGWILYANPGMHFGWASPREPLLNFPVGILTPKVAAGRLDFGLALLPQIYLSSSVFEAGSSKWMLEPQISFTLDRKAHFTLTQTFRFSVLDRLNLKPGVTLNQTSPSLLNDTLWGTTTSLNYTFQ